MQKTPDQKTKSFSAFKNFCFVCAFVSGSLFAGQAHALTFEITAPCSKEAASEGSIDLPSAPMTLGAATMLILHKEGLPFVGSDRGLNSLLHTPVGDQSLEVLSDSHMKAYGWCFEVNGRIPDELAHQFRLKGPEHLRWFYGYAEYKDGEWVSFCNQAPVNTQRRYCR